MECRVEFDYAAQEADELSLKKGDIIINVVQKMDGWWEGTLKGKTGMFPDNFVKVVSSTANSDVVTDNGEAKTEVQLRKNPVNSVRRLKALFSYAPEQEDELSLEVGDVIDFIQEVEEGWWRGQLNGRTGIFPSNFVKEHDSTTNGSAQEPGTMDQKQNDKNRVNHGKAERTAFNVEEEPAPELPPKPVREMARCFYPYQALNEDELTLNEGDIVTIISKTCEDEGWWRGEFRGKNGLFPDNFVKIISPNDPVVPLINSTNPPSNPHQKILAQGRNLSLTGADLIPKKEAVPTISVVDGIGGSKNLEKSIDTTIKSKFNKPKLKEPPGPPTAKPLTPTTPTSPAGAAFHPIPSFIIKPEAKKDIPVPKEENNEDMGDFNAVERREKLSHLTANRAKAPKRRPPSAIIIRDNDTNMMNGSMHSQETSLDSPPPAHHSTPFNLSYNTSNNTSSVISTPSTSVLDGSSLSNNSSLLQSKEKETSPSPNASGGSATGKAKQILPWMAELKQTQDKKRERALATPTNPINTVNTPPLSTSPTPIPTPVLPVVLPKEKEPAPLPTGVVPSKAPPLPAKPNTLITPAPEKNSSSINISPVSTTPINNPIKLIGKKMSSGSGGTGNYINSNSNTVNEGQGDTGKYVSYEEHAKLKDKVSSLEKELETVRRQLKLLLDRDLSQGHIV